MFLATTSLSEFWDPADELLFLGPWCTRHDRRAEWEGRKHRMLANPWDDRARFRGACRASGEVEERLLASLGDYLGAALGEHKTPRYWRTLLGMWLAYHVQQTYDHYVLLQDALAAFPELTSVGLSPESFTTPCGFDDFIRLSTSDPYHLQVYSHLLAGLRPDLPRRPFARPSRGLAAPGVKGRRGAKAAVLGAASQGLSWLRRIGLGEVLFSDLNMDRGAHWRLIAATRLRALPYLTEFGPEFQVEPRWDGARMGLAGLPAQGEFERLLVAGLPHHFPTLFLEEYHRARKHALGRLGRMPRLVFSANGLQFNDALKFAAAECSEAGGEVRVIQHGGGYGMVAELPAERQERAVADRFYAWGWAGLSRDPKASDLPHPKICAPAARRPADGSILFVSASEPVQTIRLSRGPIGTQELEVAGWQEDFIGALPEPIRARLLVRLLPADGGWGRPFGERFGGLACDDLSLPFEERLGRASMSVYDYPATTILQGIALGRPLIAYWNTRFWEFREEAEPFLEVLRAANIFFDGPRLAARHLAAVAVDPRPWWDSPPVQRAREEVRRRFACDGDWVSLWRDELCRRRI